VAKAASNKITSSSECMLSLDVGEFFV